MKIPQRLRSFEARAAKNKNEKVEMGECGILLDGKWLKTGDAIEVHSPYDDALVAVVHRAGPKEIQRP